MTWKGKGGGWSGFGAARVDGIGLLAEDISFFWDFGSILGLKHLV